MQEGILDPKNPIQLNISVLIQAISVEFNVT